MANGATSADRADGSWSVTTASSDCFARMANAADAVVYPPTLSSSIPERSDCPAGEVPPLVQLPEPLLRGEAIAHLTWKPPRVTMVPR
jgi:hypothetical protein